MTDELAEFERRKYEDVWSHDVYRKIAPGMFEAEQAFVTMRCQPGETLNDYGAGTGRAAKWFRDKGLAVLAIDFADNALEESVPFLHRCVWDLAPGPGPNDALVADYGFCTDVMEHIPRQKVDAALAAIAGRTNRAAWFRIATRHDVMGPRLIGRPLHLTVENADWWLGTVAEHFPHAEIMRDDGRDVVLLCQP